MYIAQQLKEKNIAEYLLYMWQVEDILRAHHLDPDELKQNYLAQFRATEETEKEMEEWYSHLIRMMKEEGIQEGGHLQINRNIILWLTDLHNQLLQSSKFPFYTAAYYKALPYIVELRNKGDKKDVSELENCFDALYGVMLLRLQHKPISNETAKWQRLISTMPALAASLASRYSPWGLSCVSSSASTMAITLPSVYQRSSGSSRSTS